MSLAMLNLYLTCTNFFSPSCSPLSGALLATLLRTIYFHFLFDDVATERATRYVRRTLATHHNMSTWDEHSIYFPVKANFANVLISLFFLLSIHEAVLPHAYTESHFYQLLFLNNALA
mmetsp:Transcript_45097/g.116637  ORF Transcript_45097/g.116637 Transcript_45097/m.116637 type:complete len:118 (+) Transcript_45097:142-495(+)